MKTRQTGLSLPVGSRLSQVLALGEDLLELTRQAAEQGIPANESLELVRRLVAGAVERLLNAQAVVWFTPEVIGTWTNNASGARAARAEPPELIGQSLQTGQICLRYSSGNSESFTELPETLEPVVMCAAPLRLHGRQEQTVHLLGAIQIERPADRPITAAEIELLASLAIQTALSIQSGIQTAVEMWRVQQLSLVGQVSLEISRLRGLDEVAARIARLIQQTFEYYRVNIYTLEPGEDRLHRRASIGPPNAAADSDVPAEVQSDPVVQLGEGLVGIVAQTGEEIIADDVIDEPRFRASVSLPETRSEAALPMRVHDRLVGVLDIQSNLPDDFNEIDRLVLRALAANIAIAVEDARLYKSLRRRAGQLEMLYKVSSAITSILDQEYLLEEVVDLILKRFGYPYVHVYSVHPGRRKVFYEAGSGKRSQEMLAQNIAYDLDDSLGIIPWVARHGETVLANDVSREPRYRPSPLSPGETQSELTVPLVFGGQVLGVLDVQSEQCGAFTEDDRFLFEALADHIAIALRNAYLYRTEVWQRKVSDNLREVAGLLSAEVDQDQVLQAILAVLGRTLPQDLAAIWLTEPTLDEQRDIFPGLHLAAVQGEGIAELGLEMGLTPEEVLAIHSPGESGLTVETASDWLRSVMLTGAPLVRSVDSPFDVLGAALKFPRNYSAIAAPLRVGDRPLGVLVLAHRREGKYGSEASAMTAAFASSAAVAIENARLYEAAHEQAWVSTVLLQVANATQTITDLNALLATVIHITPMLAGVKACLLYILDDDGDFVPAVASGLTGEAQTEFERWRFAPGDVTALDRMMAEKSSVFLHGGPDDNRLTGILGADSDDPDELRLTVLVPMLARGEPLGAFLVDYSAGPAAISGRSLESFFDERLAILQGIAHQTAIAVDNLQLIKSRKEEAYVSVALLQVAQAVVSSNDLDEALGSIVRITPILVGVKRAAIFLWDETHRAFRLAQAYGLPPAAAHTLFAAGEFPLMDAVLEQNTVLAHPLWSEISASDDVPESWTYLSPPTPDNVEEYIESAGCLLLAFPLAVKGNQRGVLLIEEPEPVPGEGFSGANTNRRLRAKRMEIITGISQQAALAIENDLLQHETMERERLEREMQLARDIQRTFLPQQTPLLPGWDLKVMWRTAREVGGDFYDFFELPGNRLGLVIADVADKGMPAALFMTLVRTLLRATVREIDSPSGVLERANDIIVPDASDGMFVTIFYAVLDLDTGVLEYANAGHNQPLLLRNEGCRIERLARGGMALGVLEGNLIQSGQLLLKPGDLLVLYTDGVSEAFSPELEPFGEERLIETIVKSGSCAGPQDGQAGGSSQQALDNIDQAVQDFIAGSQPSDDLTLLVLRREFETES